MSTHHISQVFIFIFSTMLLLVNGDYFYGSLANAFSPAVATWYNDPNGPGIGGACGFSTDVGYPPYYGYTAAGNANIFKGGKGCGTCYQVKCMENSYCSGNPVTLTITNECPGACNDQPFHFDLSGIAFGALAKPGQAYNLRQLGRINIQYQRVQCSYKTGITLKIDEGSNSNYLAVVIENVNGDGDVGSVELSSPTSGGWFSMQISWGEVWKVDLPSGSKGPYSVRITTILSKQSVAIKNLIPADWAPGKYYRSASNVLVVPF